MAHGVAHENPRDERLFAVAEVRDLTPVRDEAGRIVHLPQLEHRLMEAEHARDFMQREVQRLQQQEKLMERRLQEVQGELDRLIAVMLQDSASPPAQAA